MSISTTLVLSKTFHKWHPWIGSNQNKASGLNQIDKMFFSGATARARKNNSVKIMGCRKRWVPTYLKPIHKYHTQGSQYGHSFVSMMDALILTIPTFHYYKICVIIYTVELDWEFNCVFRSHDNFFGKLDIDQNTQEISSLVLSSAIKNKTLINEKKYFMKVR